MLILELKELRKPDATSSVAALKSFRREANVLIKNTAKNISNDSKVEN